MDKAPLPPSHRDGRATPAWRRDAAILVGIVRFGRIVQLIEEDRQVAVTPQRSVAVNTSFSSMNYCCFDDTTLTEIKIYTKYIYISSRSVAEELAEPEGWLASIQPKLIPL